MVCAHLVTAYSSGVPSLALQTEWSGQALLPSALVAWGNGRNVTKTFKARLCGLLETHPAAQVVAIVVGGAVVGLAGPAKNRGFYWDIFDREKNCFYSPIQYE